MDGDEARLSVGRTADLKLVAGAAALSLALGLGFDFQALIAVGLVGLAVTGLGVMTKSVATTAATAVNTTHRLATSVTALDEHAAALREQQQAFESQRVLLELKNEELRRANEAKGDFLASMSHELRTPLNAVIGFSELLQEGIAGPVNAAQAAYLDDIRKSGKHLLAVISDILDYSKLEAGRLELKQERIDLSQPVREAMEMVESLAVKKQVKLESALGDAVFVQGDATRLRQVALNLLSNAIKFTPAGGKVSARLERGDESVRLVVQDTGIGIAPEHHALIFEAFRQVDAGQSRQHEGTGLGLALVRRLLEPMQGHISVQSAPGEGSTFCVRLPLCTKVSALEVKAGTSGIDVVVAEDDDAMRLMLARLLRAQGCEVRAMPNGQRALEALAERLPTVLLLDLMMPELDGYELLERLRRLPEGPAVGVIVFTASDPSPTQHARLTSAGAHCVVKGSYPTSELVALVLRTARGATKTELRSAA